MYFEKTIFQNKKFSEKSDTILYILKSLVWYNGIWPDSHICFCIKSFEIRYIDRVFEQKSSLTQIYTLKERNGLIASSDNC